MGKFDGFLILSDFDATFTSAKTGNIPRKNIDALKYFESEGGLFSICTGRTFLGFHKYSPEYINAPVLLANGALCYDYMKKERVFFLGIREENGASAVKKIADEFPKASIELYPLNKSFVIHPSEKTAAHLDGQSIPWEETDDPYKVETPWQKIMIDATGFSMELQKFCSENFDDPVVIPTKGDFVEIIRKDMGKHVGAKALAEKLGCLPDRWCACGDGYNDVTMLESAPYSFCPADGSDEAKKSAKKTVCPSSEGTVFGAVQYLDNIL